MFSSICILFAEAAVVCKEDLDKGQASIRGGFVIAVSKSKCLQQPAEGLEGTRLYSI